MSRLTLDMTDEQHQSLKARAARHGKTVKQYCLERLFPGDASDASAWAELRDLLNERVEAGLAGEVSSKTVQDILDEELAAGGDR